MTWAAIGRRALIEQCFAELAEKVLGPRGIVIEVHDVLPPGKPVVGGNGGVLLIYQNLRPRWGRCDQCDSHGLSGT